MLIIFLLLVQGTYTQVTPVSLKEVHAIYFRIQQRKIRKLTYTLPISLRPFFKCGGERKGQRDIEKLKLQWQYLGGRKRATLVIKMEKRSARN